MEGLESGQLKLISETTGYSREYIRLILQGLKPKNSKGGRKIFKAVDIVKSNKKEMTEKIIFEMCEIDLMYARNMVDIFHFPESYCLKKWGTKDFEEIQNKLNWNYGKKSKCECITDAAKKVCNKC